MPGRALAHAPAASCAALRRARGRSGCAARCAAAAPPPRSAAHAAAEPPAKLPPRARRLAAKRAQREAERAARPASPPPPPPAPTPAQTEQSFAGDAAAMASVSAAADPLPDTPSEMLLHYALCAAAAHLRLSPPPAPAEHAAAASGEAAPLDSVAAALLARAGALERQQLADAAWALSAACHPLAVSVREAQRVPFAVRPGLLTHQQGLTLDALAAEVAFRRDAVLTAAGELVPEARLTAWQSDFGDPFEYSGKVMKPPPGGLSPAVAAARDALHGALGVRYDSCLINLYNDGKSAMRFHSDPQGAAWAADSAVVSVGAPRRFVFRSIADVAVRYAYTVRSGDVVVMGTGCQEQYQHAVLPERNAEDAQPRISLVFKKRRQ